MQNNWKKNIIVFMSCQAISLFGSSLVQYAITWYITLTTQSGVYATISIICGFLPTLFLSPFGGVWADRYSRKHLIILADGGIALSTLILALIFLSGYREIWLLFAVMGIRALGAAVQTPCIGAILPDIVPEEQLTRINGINGSLQSIILLISPMLSGALMGWVAMEYIFFIDVITAALAITLMLLLLKLPGRKQVPATEKSDYFGELKQGLRYIRDSSYLKTFFIFCAGFYILSAPVAFLTPLQVARTFNGTEWHLAAIEVAFSVGMAIGGIVIATWGGFKNRVHSLGLACIAMGVLTITLGFPGNFWLYLIFFAVIGLVMPLFNTPAMVLLQETVDPAYMGRVFGVMTMLSSSLMPLGMLIFGPLSDRIQIEYLLIFTGTVIALGSIPMLTNKALLAAGARRSTTVTEEPPA